MFIIAASGIITHSAMRAYLLVLFFLGIVPYFATSQSSQLRLDDEFDVTDIDSSKEKN